MIYGEGISHLDEVINMAVENDIIDKSGAWFSYRGDKIGQGFQAVREFMRANPAIDAEITEQVKAKLFPEPEKEESAPAGE